MPVQFSDHNSLVHNWCKFGYQIYYIVIRYWQYWIHIMFSEKYLRNRGECKTKHACNRRWWNVNIYIICIGYYKCIRRGGGGFQKNVCFSYQSTNQKTDTKENIQKENKITPNLGLLEPSFHWPTAMDVLTSFDKY